MDIEHWRNEIDDLDEELLRLLIMRARLALKVGALKKQSGIPICDADRERSVLTRLQANNRGPLDSRAVAKIFRRIICESRCVEARGIETTAETQVLESVSR
ncbi:MAG: chorismate mutase [Pyrinomonadaceae bacterium]